jgi:hypothetical protein
MEEGKQTKSRKTDDEAEIGQRQFNKVWVVTPNLPPHLIAKKLIAFFGSSSRFLEAHRVWTHNGSFFTFARWFFLKLSWKLNDNPPDVF